jgi:hypothetical protein
MPPLLIVRGKRIQEKWVSHSRLDGEVLLAVNDTGYINDLITLEWLEHFHEHLAKSQTSV